MLGSMHDLPLDPRVNPPGTRGFTSLQQSAQWLKALRHLGTRAAVEDLGEARALVIRRDLPLIGSVALISRAALLLGDMTAREVRQQLGVRHLIVNAETATDADTLSRAGFIDIAAPRRVAHLTLLPSPDRMAVGLRPKWRNRCRKGQTQGLVLTRRPMPADPRHWLLRAETVQAHALRYCPLPADLIAAIAAGTPGAAQVFTAHHHGVRVAAMLFLRHGRHATYQIGWTSPEGRKLSAANVVMWKAMVDLQAMGCEQIDLGACDPAQAPGLVRFKLGTGAQQRALGGTWLDTAWRMDRRRRARDAYLTGSEPSRRRATPDLGTAR